MRRPGTPSDASTLIYLAKANALQDAQAVVGGILVPPAVWLEAVEAGERRGERDPARIRTALEEGHLRRIVLTGAQVRAASELAARHRLGRGESQALISVRKGSRVLMDDGRASRVAEALGYVPVSSVFLPVLGYREGVLDSSSALDLLRRLTSVIALRADALMRLEASIMERPR